MAPTSTLSRDSGVDVIALAALVGAMLLWGSSFIAMKIALSGYKPIAMSFGRMTVGVIALLPLARRWSGTLQYKTGDWRIFLLLVLCEPSLYFLFEAYALEYTSAMQAGLVTSLMPLMVAVAAWLLFKERLGKKSWLGFFFALGGVVWLTLAGEPDHSAPNPLLGNTLELLAMAMGTGYALCVRRLMRYPPFFIAGVQTLGGMIFFGILLLFSPGQWPSAFPLKPTLAMVFLGACVSTGAYGLFNLGIARLGAARASAWINLLPVVTLILSFIFLGERMTPWQYAAAVPILFGLFLSQSKS